MSFAFCCSVVAGLVLGLVTRMVIIVGYRGSLKLIELCTLNMYCFLHVNYTLIKWFKKEILAVLLTSISLVPCLTYIRCFVKVCICKYGSFYFLFF